MSVVAVSLNENETSQAVEPLAGKAILRETIRAQDVLERTRGARGANGLLPACRAVRMQDAGELLARRELGGVHARLVDLVVGKKLQAVRKTAHVERFRELRIETGADDELGGAAADVHHQPALVGYGQCVRYAQIDEARLLATGNHLDRKAEHRTRLPQELRRVLGDAQRIGSDGAHRLARKAAQP